MHEVIIDRRGPLILPFDKHDLRIACIVRGQAIVGDDGGALGRPGIVRSQRGSRDLGNGRRGSGDTNSDDELPWSEVIRVTDLACRGVQEGLDAVSLPKILDIGCFGTLLERTPQQEELQFL